MYLETLLIIIITKMIQVLFVQKPYPRTKYLESNIEEDIDLKNQYRIQKLPSPQETSDAFCKS